MSESKPRFQMPPTLAILGIILLLAAISAQFLPPGAFERAEREIIVGGESQISVQAHDGATLSSLAEAYKMPEAMRDQNAERLGLRLDEVIDSGREIDLTVPRTSTRTMVIPDSYSRIERPAFGNPAERIGSFLSGVVQAPIRGFVDKAEIIGFILLLGGAFGIILSTGAVDAALKTGVSVLSRSGGQWLVIPAVMILFSLGGAIFGLSEEVIPFVMITIPLSIRLGYDSLTGLCMSFVGAGLGFAGAFMNPFTLQIAQGIAELQPLSGFGPRLVIWGAVTLIGIVYTMRWASKVKRNPELSPTFENDRKLIHKFEAPEEHTLGAREWGVLGVFALGIALIVWGVKTRGWYMIELSGVFLGVGLLSGLVGRMSLAQAANAFTKGAGELTGAALIVAVSAGVVIVMQDANILDTILNGIASLVGDFHATIGACAMFTFQTALNFLVPSGSGQAAMTMPIMVPLADAIGVSRQTAVLAYQFGDGFGNMIIPTSAVTMAVLGIAEVPWEKWAKWILPLEVILFVFGCVVLSIATIAGF